ncbi:hypothetical protein Hanom_Chr17g01554771 [Helianthus anomalus]
MRIVRRLRYAAVGRRIRWLVPLCCDRKNGMCVWLMSVGVRCLYEGGSWKMLLH